MAKHEGLRAFGFYSIRVIAIVAALTLAVLFGYTMVKLANDPSHVSQDDISQVRLWEQLAHQTVQLGTQPGSTPEEGFQARLKALQDYYQACSLLATDKDLGYSLVPGDITMFERAHCNGNP